MIAIFDRKSFTDYENPSFIVMEDWTNDLVLITLTASLLSANDAKLTANLANLKKVKGINLPQEECSICLETCETDALKLECGHHFHQMCVEKWKVMNRSCPICRRPLSGDAEYLPTFFEADIDDVTIEEAFLYSSDEDTFENAPFASYYSSDIEAMRYQSDEEMDIPPLIDLQQKEQIEFVMEQTGTTWELSMRALVKSGFDTLEAVMELTM